MEAEYFTPTLNVMSDTPRTMSAHNPPNFFQCRRAAVRWATMVSLGLFGGVALFFIGTPMCGCGGSKVDAAYLMVQESLPKYLEKYQHDIGNYPPNLAALLIPPHDQISNWHGPYLITIDHQFPPDSWGHPYIYLYPGIHHPNSYDLSSSGADGIAGNKDDITNWSATADQAAHAQP